MVMCPMVQAADGPAAVDALVRGTLRTIPGTSVFLAVLIALSPAVGFGLAVTAGLAAIPLVTAAMPLLVHAAEGAIARARHERGARPDEAAALP